MSELTAAEKRQQLRDRRAAKMAKGSGTRLNQIVNSNGSSIHEINPNETPVREGTSSSLPSRTTSAKSNRISQSFSKPVELGDDDEPEVPSLDSLNEIPDPLHGASSAGTANSVDDIFNNLLQSHQMSPQHANLGGDGPLPEDFMNTIGSIFGNGIGGGFPQPPASAGGNIDSSLKTQYGDVFALVRYIVVSIVFYLRCVGNDSCLVLLTNETQRTVSWFSNWWGSSIGPTLDCSLWETFLAVECGFSVIHLMLANSNSIPKRSKDSWAGLVLGFVPIQYKNALTITVDYFDVIVGVWKDISLLFFLLILKSYFFNK